MLLLVYSDVSERWKQTKKIHETPSNKLEIKLMFSQLTSKIIEFHVDFTAISHEFVCLKAVLCSQLCYVTSFHPVLLKCACWRWPFFQQNCPTGSCGVGPALTDDLKCFRGKRASLTPFLFCFVFPLPFTHRGQLLLLGPCSVQLGSGWQTFGPSPVPIDCAPFQAVRYFP